MEKPLEKEFKYYLDHQDELVMKYNGRVVVIKNRQIIGDFGSELDAVREISKTEPLGTFLVILCEPGTDAYTQTFHSRVAFV